MSEPVETPPVNPLAGLLVETQRAYLGWQGALAARNKAVDAETAARGAYLHLAYAASALASTEGNRLSPHDPDFVQAREAAWRRHLEEVIGSWPESPGVLDRPIRGSDDGSVEDPGTSRPVHPTP